MKTSEILDNTIKQLALLESSNADHDEREMAFNTRLILEDFRCVCEQKDFEMLHALSDEVHKKFFNLKTWIKHGNERR